MMKTRFVLLLVLCAIAAVIGFYTLWDNHVKESETTLLNESAEEREESIKKAFAEGANEEAGKGQELRFYNIAQSHFDRLAKAYENEDQKAFEVLFSGDKMFDFIERSTGLSFDSSRQRLAVKRSFSKSIIRGLFNNSNLMKFDEATIVRVEVIKENEFIAYTRLWSKDLEIYTKMRWWLVKGNDGEWAIYDYEDFDTNIRASTLTGALLGNLQGAKMPWLREFNNMITLVNESMDAGSEEGYSKVVTVADNILKHKNLPVQIRGCCLTLKASYLAAQQEFEKALVTAKILEKDYPEMPVVPYTLGTCYLGLERWDEAIVQYTAYAKKLGWDSDVHEMMSEAYYGKGDNPMALEHARKGMADNPNAYGCLASLALALPKELWPEIDGYLDKTKDKEIAYETVMDYALYEENTELAEWLFAKLKVDYPDSELIEYYAEELEPKQEGMEDETPGSSDGE